MAQKTINGYWRAHPSQDSGRRTTGHQTTPKATLAALGGLPKSLFAPPPSSSGAAAVGAAAAAAASSRRSNACGSSVCADSRGGCRCPPAVAARLEMTRPTRERPVQLDRGLDESGGSNSSSMTAISSSSRGSIVKGTNSGWSARSKVPWHMLPYEVQQYHLSSNSSSRHRASSSSGVPMPPADEETAMVESAWWPLMPPAMAGAVQPAAPAGKSMAGEATAGEAMDGRAAAHRSASADGTCRCAFVTDRLAVAHQEGAAAATGAGQPHHGSEGCWATMSGTVVHLAASQHPRRSYTPSVTATASTSSTTSNSPSSSDDSGSEEEELPRFWAASRSSSASSVHSTAAASSSSFARTPPTTPPASPAPALTEGEDELTTAAAAAEAEETLEESPSSPTDGHFSVARLLFGGGGGPDGDRRAAWLKALTLAALSGFVAGGGAATLQQVSLGLSNACRELAAWSLRVGDGGSSSSSSSSDDDDVVRRHLPPQLADHLWPRGVAPAARGGRAATQAGAGGRRAAAAGGSLTGTAGRGSRLQPRRSITRVVVQGGGGTGARGSDVVTSAAWPPTMRSLEFGPGFNSPVEGVRLPDGVEAVTFGASFNQPVSRVRWPRNLRELAFGNDFNQPVSGIRLPAGVRRLDFGGRFNSAISAVDFPEELRELRLGHGFNREITGVRWPPRLSKLEFCGELTQRIEDVALPPTLAHLALLGDFDQPVHAVKWPAALVTVRFGDRFRQPVAAGVPWPASLRKIVVGRSYGRLRPSECGGGGPAGDLEAPEARRSLALLSSPGEVAAAEEDAHSSGSLPPTCEVVVVPVNDGDDGDDEEEGHEGCGSDEVEGVGTIVLADGYGGLRDNSCRGGAGAAGEGGEKDSLAVTATGGDRGPVDLDGVYTDDEGRSQSGWGGEEEGGDGGELECIDVFGFEDGAWDMGDPWGSY